MSAFEDAQRAEAEARAVVMERARFRESIPRGGTFAGQLTAYAEAVRRTERVRAHEVLRAATNTVALWAGGADVDDVIQSLDAALAAYRESQS